jgi:hypothetical protein
LPTALYVPTLPPDAVLLQARLAVVALAAGVDHAADAHAVADRELGDAGADLGDDAGDLVAGDHREDGLAPALLGLVDVGVADTGELDVDQNVVLADGRRSMVVRSSGALAAGAAYAATVVMPKVLLRRGSAPGLPSGRARRPACSSSWEVTQTTPLRTFAGPTTDGVRFVCVRP